MIFFSRQNFVRKSHSTYGSIIALNGGDDRNHGSADAIPMLRDDESETNDTEMLNDIETMDDGNNDENEAADEHEAMEENETELLEVKSQLIHTLETFLV